MRPRSGTALTLTLLLCGALSACAGGGDGTQLSTEPRTVRPVAGCGARAWTDPAQLGKDRAPARCAGNTPAPRPLARKRKLTIATGTLSAEYVAPLRLAQQRGEFAKEGLDVDIRVLPTPDALPLLAKGEIDALWAAPEAAVVNGVKGGFNIRWVAGNFSPDPSSKSGLWVRLKKGETAKSARMAGRTIGTMIGKGSVIASPMDRIFARHGATMDDVTFQQLGSADVLTALNGGGTDAAWLLDPVWRKTERNPRYAFLGGQPLGEPLGGALYGPNLLGKDVDAGVALLRGYIRTVNTHFAGNYKKDPAVVAELARMQGQSPQSVRSVPPLRFDWEIRAGTTDRLQRAYQDARVTKDGTLPEHRLVDRRLYAEAVGHQPPRSR